MDSAAVRRTAAESRGGVLVWLSDKDGNKPSCKLHSGCYNARRRRVADTGNTPNLTNSVSHRARGYQSETFH